jgi:hypothetical protein
MARSLSFIIIAVDTVDDYFPFWNFYLKTPLLMGYQVVLG